MIDPVVRGAEPGDVGPLAALEAEARAVVAPTRGGARWLDEHAEVGERWAALVAAGEVFVAVLEVGDAGATDRLVVGYLVLELDGPLARIDQVWVTPEARELGFGDALLAAAEAAARRAGAAYLEGQALPGDRQTKNLYERAGITARSITVSRALR